MSQFQFPSQMPVKVQEQVQAFSNFSLRRRVKCAVYGLAFFSLAALVAYAAVDPAANSARPPGQRMNASETQPADSGSSGSDSSDSGSSGSEPTPVPTLLPPPPDPGATQSIAKLQYSFNAGRSWQDLPDNAAPISAGAGQSVGIRAIRQKAELPWPIRPLKPQWNNGGTTHFGGQIFVKYDTATQGSNVNVVSVECGNVLSAKIKVHPIYRVYVYSRSKEAEANRGRAHQGRIRLLADVTLFNDVPAPGVKVRFTARSYDGNVAGIINADGTADDTVVSDARGRSEAVIHSVNQKGPVRITAIVVSADGEDLIESKGTIIGFK